MGRSCLTWARIRFLLNLTIVAPRCTSWSVVTPSRTPSEPLSILFCDHAKDCSIGASYLHWEAADRRRTASRETDGSNDVARCNRTGLETESPLLQKSSHQTSQR